MRRSRRLIAQQIARGARPIEVLSDDILLIIFRHYLDASASVWFRLAHVCQSWRQIIFRSPLGLRLRLHCTYETPVLKTLDHWPPFPLVLNYGGLPILRPPSPEDEDNIMAALENSDRVRSINFTLSSSLLEKLSTISNPFSELEEIDLQSQENVQLTLPGTFWWGHRLRTLHSTRIAFPSLPQLLLPSQDLVDLQLNEIPLVGYFSPEAFANALCGMNQLESLSLHFLSLPPRRHYLSLPPPPGDRVILPGLTSFRYRGISKYLDNLVARIDAPRLGDFDITFFNQPTLDASQLGLFINRVDMWRTPLRVDILSSRDAISITFSLQGAPWFGLEISCKQLDWQISSLSQVCDHFPSFMYSAEDLRIETIGPSSMPGDRDEGQWLRLLRTFNGAKDFCVAGELSSEILRSLSPTDEDDQIVFLALRNLYIQEPGSMLAGPLWDSIKSFDTQRRHSSHPVQIYVESTHVTRWRQEEQAQVENVLRSQVAEGLLTRDQAQESLSLLRTRLAHDFQEENVLQHIPSGFTIGGTAGDSAQQQLAALSQHLHAPTTNPMSSLQRVMQAQDSFDARQLNMLVAQSRAQTTLTGIREFEEGRVWQKMQMRRLQQQLNPVEMLTKLKQVETRMTELRNKQIEAVQAGRTDEANKLALILSQHVTAYKKGREFMLKMWEAKRAAQEQ